MIVVLIGYMGAGKSTIGSTLAEVLGYNFIDLDDYIAIKEKNSISNLFKSKGEIYFRRKETQYLKAIIENSDHTVLALGGGTPCYGNNFELLQRFCKVKTIYLKLSISLLTERLFTERHKRPLISHIQSKEDLLEFIGKHIFERVQYYSKAQITLDINHKPKQEVLELLVSKLV